MNCRECVEHLYEFLDRELTPELEREIRDHLEDCPPCGGAVRFRRVVPEHSCARGADAGAPAELKKRACCVS